MNNIENRNNVIRTVFQTPEPEIFENMNFKFKYLNYIILILFNFYYD